jgi:hypothetical protein
MRLDVIDKSPWLRDVSCNGGNRYTEDRLIEIIKAYDYLKVVAHRA